MRRKKIRWVCDIGPTSFQYWEMLQTYSYIAQMLVQRCNPYASKTICGAVDVSIVIVLGIRPKDHSSIERTNQMIRCRETATIRRP